MVSLVLQTTLDRVNVQLHSTGEWAHTHFSTYGYHGTVTTKYGEWYHSLYFLQVIQERRLLPEAGGGGWAGGRRRGGRTGRERERVSTWSPCSLFNNRNTAGSLCICIWIYLVEFVGFWCFGGRPYSHTEEPEGNVGVRIAEWSVCLTPSRKVLGFNPNLYLLIMLQ